MKIEINYDNHIFAEILAFDLKRGLYHEAILVEVSNGITLEAMEAIEKYLGCYQIDTFGSMLVRVHFLIVQLVTPTSF